MVIENVKSYGPIATVFEKYKSLKAELGLSGDPGSSNIL